MTTISVWRFYVKEIFRRWEFWVLAIILTAFWQSTGAYIFSRYSIPLEVRQRISVEVLRKVALLYTGGWYGIAALFMLSFIAVALVHIICHSIVAVRYLSKYSRVSASRLFTGLALAALTAVFIAMFFLLGSTVVFYSHEFYDLKELLTPKNYLGIIAVTVAGGLFTYFLSMTLALLVVILKKPRMLTPISFVPIMLAFALGYTANYAENIEIQVLPFALITRLSEHYYSNITIDITKPSVKVLIAEIKRLETRVDLLNPIDPLLVWFMLICWITLFTLISILLFKRQKGINIEEIIG